jgi:hypothetical protein
MSTVTRNLLCLLSRGQPMTGYPYGLLWTPYQSGFTGYGLASSVAHAGLHNVGVHRHATRRGVIKAMLAFINLVSLWLSVLRAAYDYAVLLTASLPRTMRTAVWLMRAGLSYKIHLARIASEDPESDKVQEILSVLHTRWARELLSVCRANGEHGHMHGACSMSSMASTMHGGPWACCKLYRLQSAHSLLGATMAHTC